MPFIESIAAPYLIIINAICFILFFIDKLAAKKGDRRIREKTLIILCVLGGAPGGFTAMRLFRHKTRDRAFKAVPVLFLIWLMAGVYFFWLRLL